MRTSLACLGKKWGNLAVVRGTTKYHISPFEQKAFAGAITKGIPNTLWRFRTNVLYWAPRKMSSLFYEFSVYSKTFSFAALLITYLIYNAVEAEHDRLQRKQPGEFDHET